MLTASDQYLGCLMIDPTAILKAQVPAEAIDADLRDLYKAISGRIINNEPVDTISLAMAYREENWWPGTARVSEMPDIAVSKILIKKYAKDLKEEHLRSSLESWNTKAKEIIQTRNPSEAIVELESGLSALIDPELRPPYESFEVAGKEYFARKSLENCIKTGNEMIDTNWYLNNGGLHIIAARTGVGKTTFACWLMTQLLKDKKPVLFFSLEMSQVEIINKILHIWTMGKEDEYKTMYDLKKEEKLLICDRPGLTIEEMFLISSLAKRNLGLGAIFVDYIQLVRTSERVKSIYERVTHVSLMLKELARRFDCPVIVAAQVNRAVEGIKDKRPLLSHLRDSGSIEQDADSVVMLYRDDYYEPTEENHGVTEINIAKQRQRPSARLECDWDRDTSQWTGWRRQRIVKKAGSSFQEKFTQGKTFYTP